MGVVYVIKSLLLLPDIYGIYILSIYFFLPPVLLWPSLFFICMLGRCSAG
jgi:hypothetical protein